MARHQHCTLLFFKCLITLYSIFNSCCAQSYTFTEDPQSVVFEKGQTASLSCEWTPALNGTHTVFWAAFPSGGTSHLIGSSTLKYNVTSKATFSYLSIFNSDSDDVGRYRCDISKGGDSYILSREAFVWQEITCSGNGEIGKTLKCSFAASSPSDIFLGWYNKDGYQVESKLHPNNILESRPLTAEDNRAVFTCKAWDRLEHKVVGICETTPFLSIHQCRN